MFCNLGEGGGGGGCCLFVCCLVFFLGGVYLFFPSVMNYVHEVFTNEQ